MSRESTNVPFATRLFEGQILNEYMVSNILPDPVDYSVQIKCLSCSDFIPTQYYSPSGNALGLANSVYIDPEDFTENLNITLITRAFIKGQIKLDKEVSENLEINLSVLSKNITNFTYETAVITLPAGETTIDYQLIGLSRNIGDDEYQVSVQCLNCFGASSGQQFLPIALSPNENHLNIDFEIANAVTQPTSSLAAIIQLLLAEAEDEDEE